NRDGRNPNINPNSNNRPENERTMPARINRPERGERLHSSPDNLNRRVSPAPERQIQPRTERQYQPQQREVQRRQPEASPAMREQRPAPVMRQHEGRSGSPAQSRSADRPARSGGGEGRRPDRGN
ncbi:MAG TPA: hypothetical protein VK616_17415, partial [Flavitalea sp.]|nr:hypothetical protein [Flavitalea sp.]